MRMRMMLVFRFSQRFDVFEMRFGSGLSCVKFVKQSPPPSTTHPALSNHWITCQLALSVMMVMMMMMVMTSRKLS